MVKNNSYHWDATSHLQTQLSEFRKITHFTWLSTHFNILGSFFCCATHSGILRQGCLLPCHPDLSLSSLSCKHTEADRASHGLESQFYTKVLLSQHHCRVCILSQELFKLRFGRLAPPITVFGDSWGNCLPFDSQGKLSHKLLSTNSFPQFQHTSWLSDSPEWAEHRFPSQHQPEKSHRAASFGKDS